MKESKKGEVYSLVGYNGYVTRCVDQQLPSDDESFDCHNYFNDEAFANQVALHQLLYRKLLKYAYDNKCEDEEWNGNNMHAYIIYSFMNKDYDIRWTCDDKKQGTVYFKSTTWATAALNEVVMPFAKEHPEFVW